VVLVQVPTSHGKADLTVYRDASAKILTVLCNKYSSCTVERASIDEVYIDVSVEAAKHLEENSSEHFLADAIATLTAVPSLIVGDDTVEVTLDRGHLRRGHNGTEMSANSYASEGEVGAGDEDQKRVISAWFTRPPELWSTEDKLLVAGALVVNQLRQAVYDELGFTCSAGIANNKILAKLSSGMHKPNKQTLAPQCVVPGLMKDLPYNRIQGLGGKLGSAIETVYGERVRTMGQILAVPQAELARHFGAETAQWLHDISRGIDHEPVVDRALPISIGCSKTFRGITRLTPAHVADGTVLKWLKELASEVHERVTTDTKTNSRTPRSLHAGASVKIYAEGELDALTAHAADKDAWGAWFAEEGFHLSKICAMPGNATAETMARVSLQMLSKAIFEHPKFTAAMASATTSGSKSSGQVAHGVTSATSPLAEAASPAGKVKPEGAVRGSQRLLPSTEQPVSAATAMLTSSRLLWAITEMSMSAAQFQTIETGAGSIKAYFEKRAAGPELELASEELGRSEEKTEVGGAGQLLQKGSPQKHRQPTRDQKRLKKEDMFGRSHNSKGRAEGEVPTPQVEAPTSFALAEADDVAVIEAAPVASEGVKLLVAGQQPAPENTATVATPSKHSPAPQLRQVYEPQSMGDVDSAVFLTLPPEIQREIELTLRLREQRNRPAQQNSKSGPAPAPAAAGLRAHFGGPKGKPAVPQNAHTTVERSTVEHEVRSMADVDSAVFLTLPPDIQREIELTMRLRQQQQRNRTN
jgi:nucleotidyltransferase/DNA polymerase involved in DNA repair